MELIRFSKIKKSEKNLILAPINPKFTRQTL